MKNKKYLYRLDVFMIDDYGETYNKEIFLVASDFAGAFEIFKRLKNDFPVSSVTITEEQEL